MAASVPQLEELAARLKMDKSDTRQPTHLSLRGGRYIVTDLNEFNRALAYALFCGKKFFYVEYRTPVFRMHFDIDFIQETLISDDDVCRFANALSVVMATFYPPHEGDGEDRRFKCIILKAPPKNVNPPDGQPEDAPDVESCCKSGFHFIWPFLAVTQEQGLLLRHACLQEVEARMPTREWPQNPYSDVLDECVLKDNGLRMVGADKCDPCPCVESVPRSQRKNLPDCDQCLGARKIPAGRPYVPMCMINIDGTVDEARTARLTGTGGRDYQFRVHYCSIRREGDETPGFQTPALLTACPTVVQEQRKKKRKQRSQSGLNETVAGETRAEEVNRDTEAFGSVERFLQTHMGEAYRDIHLKKLSHDVNKDKFYCKVGGPGASFCHNVRRDHGSSTIYFLITKEGVCQRCFCRKDNSGVTGGKRCGLYAGDLVRLPSAIYDALFGLAEAAAEAPPQIDPALTGRDRQVALNHHRLNAVAEGISQQTERILEIRKARKAQKDKRENKKLTKLMGRARTIEPTHSGPEGTGKTWREIRNMSFSELAELDRQNRKRNQEAASRMHEEVYSGDKKKRRQTAQRGKNAKKKRPSAVNSLY